MTDFLPDGVYFDLPEDVYFAQERFSKSDVKKIRVSPADWWAESYLNESPFPLTDAQIEAREKARVLGRAYHCARLEPDRLDERFVRQLEKGDFDSEKLLTSDSAVKARLKELGQQQTIKGETPEERAQRLLGLDDGSLIWSVELARWQEDAGQRQPIAGLFWDQMLVDQDHLRASLPIHQMLSGGAAEVSILWTCQDTGMRLSSRLDYLKGDAWAELKTFSNPNGKELEQCLRDAVMFNGYYIDVAFQLQALRAARDLPAFGSSDGSPYPFESEILEQLNALRDEPSHSIIFQQKGGVPNIVSRSLELWRLPLDAAMIEGALSHDERADLWRNRKIPSAVHQRALIEIESAKRTFLQYSQVYERGEPWLPFDPVGRITDYDFPPYWLEKEVK